MFGKERRAAAADGEGVDTVVLEGSRIDGNLEVPGSFRLLGRLDGNLEANGTVWIGPTAQVTGDVRAQSATIAGQVRGNVRAMGSVELQPGSRLEGDVYAMSFRIEDGATFLGKCYMGESYVLREARK